MADEKVASFNIMKNRDCGDGSGKFTTFRPQWPNNKVTVDVPIPAGEYQISVWAYSDTGNLSLSFNLPYKKPDQEVEQVEELIDGGHDDPRFS